MLVQERGEAMHLLLSKAMQQQGSENEDSDRNRAFSSSYCCAKLAPMKTRLTPTPTLELLSVEFPDADELAMLRAWYRHAGSQSRGTLVPASGAEVGRRAVRV